MVVGVLVGVLVGEVVGEVVVPPPWFSVGSADLVGVSDIVLISLQSWELSQVDQLVNEYKPEYQAGQHIV